MIDIFTLLPHGFPEVGDVEQHFEPDLSLSVVKYPFEITEVVSSSSTTLELVERDSAAWILRWVVGLARDDRILAPVLFTIS